MHLCNCTYSYIWCQSLSFCRARTRTITRLRGSSRCPFRATHASSATSCRCTRSAFSSKSPTLSARAESSSSPTPSASRLPTIYSRKLSSFRSPSSLLFIVLGSSLLFCSCCFLSVLLVMAYVVYVNACEIITCTHVALSGRYRRSSRSSTLSPKASESS